jgi:hypothetical protein
LEIAGLSKEFGRIIGKLMALQNVGKLLTPFGIYFILKNFSNGYQILAILDLLVRSIATLYVFKFKEGKDVNLLQRKTLKQIIDYQKIVFKKAYSYLANNSNLKKLLISVSLSSDF